MSSITGSGQFHDPAFIYGDGAGTYFDNIQVGGTIVLSDLGTEQNGVLATSIGHDTYSIVSNIPNSSYGFNYTVGGETRFKIENSGVRVYTAGSLQPVSYTELSYLQNARNNIQGQIDALNPAGSNSYWGYAYSTTGNQTLPSANTVRYGYLYNVDPSGNGTQLSDASGGSAPYRTLQVLYAGIYQIVANFQVIHPNSNATTFSAWFQKNGTNIGSSLKQFRIVGQGAYNCFQLEMTMALAVNDKIGIQWTADDAAVYLAYTAPITSPYAAPASQAYTLAISQLSTNSPYYANSASDSALLAEDFATQAYNYSQSAISASTSASTSAYNAGTSETSASNYASQAKTSSDSAYSYASQAKTSATNSANSANTAYGYAGNASDYAAQAKSSADSAAISAGVASGAAVAAGVSATAAGTSATAATASAAAAAGSATASAASAGESSASAGESATSAAEAKDSSTQASSASNNAKGYRDETKGYRDETKDLLDEAGGYVSRINTLENKTQYQTSVNAPFQETRFSSPVITSNKFEIQEAGVGIAGLSQSGQVYGKTVSIGNDGTLGSQVNGTVYLGGTTAQTNLYKVVVNGAPSTTTFYNAVSVNVDSSTFYGNTVIYPNQVNVGDYIRLYPASGQIYCNMLVAGAIAIPPSTFFNNWI